MLNGVTGSEYGILMRKYMRRNCMKGQKNMDGSHRKVDCEDGSRIELIWDHICQYSVEQAVLNLQVATREVVRCLVT
jgi:hypothetical protein